MRKITIVFVLLSVGFTVASGQNASDSITMEKVFGGYQFYKSDIRLSMNQLVHAVRTNEQAYQEIRSARTTFTLANVIGGMGGFMVGWPIGTAIGGGDPNWVMAGIGVGLVIVSIPVNQSSNKQARHAVEIYNEGLRTYDPRVGTEMKFTFTGNGAGLIMKF